MADALPETDSGICESAEKGSVPPAIECTAPIDPAGGSEQTVRSAEMEYEDRDKLESADKSAERTSEGYKSLSDTVVESEDSKQQGLESKVEDLKVSPGAEAKSVELTKSPEGKSHSRWKVKTFVQKLFGSSPKKKKQPTSVEDSKGSEIPKKTFPIAEYTVDFESPSPDCESSSYVATDESELLTTPDEEVAPTGAEQRSGSSSTLHNLFEKCKDVMRSPKKGDEGAGPSHLSAETQTEKVFVRRVEESAENLSPTLEVPLAGDSGSKTSEKGFVSSMLDKTKEIFAKSKRTASTSTAEVEIFTPSSSEVSSSTSSEVQWPAIPETPSSGALADVSADSTVASPPSTSSSSITASFKELFQQADSESKQPTRFDTVVEVPKSKRAENTLLRKVTEEDSLDETAVKPSGSPGCSSGGVGSKGGGTPPLQRQQRMVQESSSEESFAAPEKPPRSKRDEIPDSSQQPESKDGKRVVDEDSIADFESPSKKQNMGEE